MQPVLMVPLQVEDAGVGRCLPRRLHERVPSVQVVLQAQHPLRVFVEPGQGVEVHMVTEEDQHLRAVARYERHRARYGLLVREDAVGVGEAGETRSCSILVRSRHYHAPS